MKLLPTSKEDRMFMDLVRQYTKRICDLFSIPWFMIRKKSKIKRMSIKEFREFGYLQEVNRMFLHPLGLALEIVVDNKTGEMRLGGIWDYREDAEGMYFDPEDIDDVKINNVKLEWHKRISTRIDLLGSVVQKSKNESWGYTND